MATPGMGRGNRWGCFVLCVTVAGLTTAGLALPAEAQLLPQLFMTSELGNGADWLYGVNPLIVQPGQSTTSRVQVTTNLFNPPASYAGPANVQVVCCQDAVSRAPIGLPAGVTVTLTQTFQICPPPVRFPYHCNQITTAFPQGVTVNVSPTTTATLGLSVAASSTAVLGQFIATVVADTGQTNTSTDVWINVEPPAMPADGPAPACTTGLELLSLQSITPDPIAWKKAHPTQTTYEVGMNLPDGTRGLDVKFVNPSSTPTTPMSPGTARVTFTNMTWPMQIRTTDSRTCAAGTTVNIPGLSTATLGISATTTTSLIIANSVCPNAFSCWTGVGLGMQDVVTFSEGNFWTLFSGHLVLMSTVGNWTGPPGLTATGGF